MTHTVKSIESMFSNAVHVMAHQPRRETAKDPECSYAPLSIMSYNKGEYSIKEEQQEAQKTT